jgi:hypothetical protein
MKTIDDILKKYGVYPKELLKELEEYKTQSIKQAFDETTKNKKEEPNNDVVKYSDNSIGNIGSNNYFVEGYNQAIEDQKVAQDKFLKL